MLSTKNSTSWPWSRKCSATVRPLRRDAGAGAGRLVHLAIDQAHLEPLALPAFFGSMLTLDSITSAGRDRCPRACARPRPRTPSAAVRLGDVVHQLHDEHGLADAGATEQADLATLGVGGEQVHDFDARLQDLRLGGLLDEGRGRLVDGAPGGGLDGASLVNRVADHVHDAAQCLVADGDGDGGAGIGHVLAAGEALRGSMAMVRTECSPRCWATSSTRRPPAWFLVSSAFRISGRWSSELHVHDGAHDLANLADFVGCHDCSS